MVVVALVPIEAYPADRPVEEALFAKDCNDVQIFECPRFKSAVIVPDVVTGVLPTVSVEFVEERPTDVTDPDPLLLNVLQSVPVKQPVTPADAEVQVITDGVAPRTDIGLEKTIGAVPVRVVVADD